MQYGWILSGQASHVDRSRVTFADCRSSNPGMMVIGISVSLYLLVSWKRFQMKKLSCLSLRSVMTCGLRSVQEYAYVRGMGNQAKYMKQQRDAIPCSVEGSAYEIFWFHMTAIT
jgi:hypothetical protein